VPGPARDGSLHGAIVPQPGPVRTATFSA
jgi:hypothetical protein